MSPEDLENRFTYHSPREHDEADKRSQVKRYNKIRETAKFFALDLDDMCPDSRELSLAITHLEEAVMWANASIARHE